MKRIQLAVIGAGLIGQKHLALVHANPDYELVAVCDAHPSGATTAANYGVPFYQDYTRLLAEHRLQGVIVATPTNTHVAVAIACAQRGIHTLVEKPIASTVAEASELLAAAELARAHVLVGHHRRHNPLVQRAREIIQRGEIGRLVGLTALFALRKPDEYFDVLWRTQPGGGPILINLIHDIDTLRYICGEIDSVYALSRSSIRGLAVEDSASLTLGFASGAIGSVLLSDTTSSPWSYELTSGENLSYPSTGQDCYFFCGTEGSLAFPSLTGWRYPPGQPAGWYQPLHQHRWPIPAFVDPLAAQLAHFCRVIRGQDLPLVSGAEGLRTLAVVQAALASAHGGLPVPLATAAEAEN